jgi:hypothetical protein
MQTVLKECKHIIQCALPSLNEMEETCRNTLEFNEDGESKNQGSVHTHW